MSTPYTIPLTNQSQKLSVSLAGVTYQLQVVWNKFVGWVMDVSSSTGVPIIQGVPLVTGANLLAQYGYLGLAGGSKMIVQSDSYPLQPPSYTSLGQTSQLYLVTKT